MVDQLEDVTIRTATPDDARAIARVHIASWREAYAGIVPDEYLSSLDIDAREKRWLDVISDGTSSTWLAEIARRTVGFANIGPCRDEDAEEGDLELYAIYLDPEAWGRGVARDLMRTLLAEVPPTTPVSLWVLADNDRARHFYRRHGFAPDGVEKIEEYSDKGLTEVRYRRA
ncbi:Ribosomal protein S18 acetylase RimI [Sanguibacter gelidistatuariae]|uniref:Ribosomal protein S18 acetylase RimI n=1 Tax=Sanguibacter gelidistatuariae TaxID=1814289 RepID=A0A1G6WGU7_9MICO|nr:N-acetyltransferase [Sanguibacter gelidistatuariae]SDD65004.1 Ribosomal protein S18 acetylase RimI [Sanguibacter gelidistatuariae]